MENMLCQKGRCEVAIITEEIKALSREIREENGRREELLGHKCNWEHMTRWAVLREYGDPARWPAFKEKPKAVVEGESTQ